MAENTPQHNRRSNGIEPGRFCEKLARVLDLIISISARRLEFSVRDIADEFRDRCERTMRRDLNTLAIMGFVDRIQPRENGPIRYKWVYRSRFSRPVDPVEPLEQ